MEKSTFIGEAVRSGGDYLLIFALGSCALVLAPVVDLVVGAIGGRS